MILDILRPSPQMKILIIGDELDEIVEIFSDFIKTYNGSMDIASYTNLNFTSPQIKRCDKIKDYSGQPKGSARDYEYVILKDTLSIHENPIKLLKNIYRSMENSAEIIVLQDQNLLFDTEGMLDECEFRTPNKIHDIWKNYDAVVAKKMHMWGNGL